MGKKKLLQFDDLAMRLVFEDRAMTVRLADFTPVEAQRYHQLTGVEIEHAFMTVPGLRLLAPLLWLVHARDEPGLTYNEFAPRVSHGSFGIGEPDDEPAEDADPEASSAG